MIHKEGILTILIGILLCVIAWFMLYNYGGIITQVVFGATLILLGLILWFFRSPNRKILVTSDDKIYAPADGKIVVIEETFEPEYFKDKRIQVSIFMSPLNVHVNRIPISGKIVSAVLHPGKYLMAWNPKSSFENERSTVVIKANKETILMRQIAGFLARRIVMYVKDGQEVTQGQTMGFIKFGSRVDLFLPLGTKINVQKGEKAIGNRTIIATL